MFLKSVEDIHVMTEKAKKYNITGNHGNIIFLLAWPFLHLACAYSCVLLN